MRISVQLDRQSEKAMEQAMRSLTKVVGAQASAGLEIIGYHTAKSLASKIQPFGMSRIEKTPGSVQKQVWRAIKNAQLTGNGGDIRQAHQSRRNAKGQVPKTLPDKGRYKMKPYPADQVSQLAMQRASHVGLAKGSWVEAAESLDMGRVECPEVVRRHATGGNGSSTKGGALFMPFLSISSHVSYMRKLLRDSTIQNALERGRKAALKYMERVISRATRELSKANAREAKREERAIRSLAKAIAKEASRANA